MSKNTAILSLCVVVAAGAAACSKPEPKPEPQTSTAAVEAPPAKAVSIDRSMLVQFDKLPKQFDSKTNPITPDKVALGKQLYFDKRFSKAQDTSCNSCHGLDTYGVDSKPKGVGHRGQASARNASTVINAAGAFVQFWDGRGATVESPELLPAFSPLDTSAKGDQALLAVVNSMPEYVASFKKAFTDDKAPVSVVNFGKAIGAFQRTLVVPAPIDQYLSGDESALTEAQKAGLAKYMEVGCTTCHAGNLWGGAIYQKLGLAVPWPDQTDLGRYQVTKMDSDKMMFKTPGLRNVAKTAPYYHNGSIATLPEAVKSMAKHQLGKNLSDEETASIVAFLDSLTGPVPAEWGKAPELPKSTAKTPKPDLK